ncbi:zinc finger protein Rlf [Polypterus senegalus]|uniref:zinc finger protein Rlf n=1 Tax=Polypterus senegalus TaxID=55291 RepID=UPI0019636D1E|nr:zinc finger protein Rlf [Polypterus senegalus]
MADGEGEKEQNKKERPCIIKTETSFSLDNFHLTLNELESELRRQGLSEFSSNEYCNRFCQALVQYAGSRNTQEHGAALLEVYRISIERFAVARPYLTTDCENVLLVVKRLALSCFELLLSLPDTELTRECWLCLHQSLQKAHATLAEYGNNDLLALLEITGAGGSWNNSVLVRILAQMPYEQEEANAWISQEGPSFLELRVKHLIKIGTIPQAVLLAKLCSESDFIPQKSMFRQTYISLLCSMLPSEDVISEISSIDCKEVLDIICNLEAEGQENTAFVLCTTYLTQQLQKESICFSWELTLFWSKLQRRIDSSLDSFLERCRQFGSIAKTAYHLLFLVKVIQSEAEELGLAVSIELCVRAFQIPSQDDAETRSSLCKIVACLLSEDLEVRRVCQLTQFLLGPTQEAYDLLQELYLKPDQKYDEENCIIPNSLRCELLLALKALWPFDPEFWDWKTLKRHCQKLLGVDPSDESEPEEPSETEHHLLSGSNTHVDVSHSGESFLSDQQQQLDYYEEGRVEKQQQQQQQQQQQKKDDLALKKKKPVGTSERYQRWLQYKFLCVICSREVIEARILHHSKMHMVDGIFTCPVCLQKFEGKQAFMPHLAEHIRMPSRKNHRPQKKKKKKKIVKKLDDDDDDDLDLEDGNLEPGDVRLDPNAPENCQNTLGLDPVLQTLTPRKLDESDHITFSYIDANFELRDRDIYPCPATDCVRIFKHFKYLSIHIKSEHSETDENIKHYMEMKDRRQKCTFCRRHFLTPFHHRQHRRVHYGPQPYMCVAVDCDARFSSTNELVSHKQSHGYQLSYQCELKGCSLKFSDLGQLYHHEAQHFRDAAYNCMHPGCKKFYFSKKEFAKHLSTHGISFTDEDLVAASKNKPALFGLVGDFPEVGAEGKSVEITAPQPESVNGPKSILEELINGIKKESTEISQLANSPSSQTSSTGSNLTGTLTSVAVCFDGKTFTCGFEGCGLTFAVAKDIQKHLKLAHPLQFRKKGESSKNLCRGKIAARRVQHMKPPIINQQTLGGQSSSLPSNVSGQVTSFSPQMNSVNPLSPHPSTSNEESLMEILIALSRLSLNTSNAASTSVLTSLPFSGSNVQVSSPFFTGASSPAKVIDRKTLFKSHRSNKPQQLRVPAVDGGLVSPSSFLSQLPEEEHKQLSQFLVQPNTKPYFCELKDCKFRSVTRSALLVHYLKKHNLPKEKVVGMKMFHSKFRPFKCHLCPRCFTRKSQLRVHLMDKHDLSKSLVAQMSCSEKRRAREEPNMVGKPSGCLDLQGNATGKTEQQPPASVQSQGSVSNNRWPWITKSEWDNSIQGEDEEEDEEDDEEDDGEAEEDDDETDGTGKPSISEDNGEESHEGRGSRRLVAKSNLCYILTKYHKPFHCVHKDCSSAFTNQNGLIRHLQSVHRYNRNQLSLEEDLQQIEGNKKDLAKHKGRPCKHKACDKRFHTDESLSAENLQLQNLDQDLPALKAPGLQTPASEEPIPQFSCSYTNCSASYHLYSSLLRHIRLFHKGQFTKPNDPRSHHRCTFDGCARVFSNADNLKQHIFFRHWEHYDSFVFGLKNKKESNEKNNVQNFQKKPPEIGVPQTRTPKGETHSKQSVIQMPKVRTSSLVMASRRIKRRRKETLLFRTPEEALQMCQDRCFSVAFPCMVQDCESVVTLESSLIRHYKRCHDMLPSYIAGKYKDLVNNAEKLEEIIQNKSAASAVSSNEVCTSALADGKDEQKTLETSPLGPELQICLSPIKPKPDEEVDHLDFEGDVPSNKLLIDADALLYGEVVKNGCMSEQVNRNVHEPDKSKPDPLSSTPSPLFYKKDEGFVDFANTGTVSFSTPSRPPLKRKNEQEDPNFSPSIENQQCHLSNNRGSQPKTFDLKAYKPMGFESSFLKFIQESNDKDEDYEETSQWDPCLSDAQLVTKRKDSYRRACSVKENNQTGMGLTRGKTASLVHGKLTDFQPMLSAEESATVQNLKSILDKALTDCGDLALKQLHYLKPVVVLERPKFPKSLLDLLPTKKTNEFCVGSS